VKNEVLDENPVLMLLYLWRDIGRVKLKYSGENLFFDTLRYHTHHVDWITMEDIYAAADFGE
jgi:hypothetical protein